MRCEVCGEYQKGIKHLFAGYGWAVQFCEEHCPREKDGWKCEDHDDDEPQEKGVSEEQN